MSITEDDLDLNPRLKLLVGKALARDGQISGRKAITFGSDFYGFEDSRFNKYGIDISDKGKQERTYRDGTLFASVGEMYRWDYLLNIQRAGEIRDLQKQVPFELQESFVSEQYGNIQALIYVSDFVYYNISFRKGFENRMVVEDVKGSKKSLTKEYKNKKKLFLYKYPKYLFFEVYPDE